MKSPVKGKEKDVDVEDTDTQQDVVESPKEKKIEISEAVLRELIDSNKTLKIQVDALNSNAVATNQNNGMVVRKKTNDMNIKLRKWNNVFVVGFENVGRENRPVYIYDIIDPTTRKAVQTVNLLLADGEKVTGIDYLEFLREAEVVENLKVVKKEKIEDVKEFGMIPKKDFAQNGYGMFETMVLVPVEVITEKFNFEVELPDNEGTLKISSEWVNM